MKETKVFCDYCGQETDDYYGVNVGWCNEREYKTFEVCSECKENSVLFVNEKERENIKTSKSHDTLLGIFRMIFKNR